MTIPEYVIRAPGGDDATAARRADFGRQETPADRTGLNLADTLAELRVAQTGVQIPCGFVGASRAAQFAKASGTERVVYLVAVVRRAMAAGRKAMRVTTTNRLMHGGFRCCSAHWPQRFGLWSWS